MSPKDFVIITISLLALGVSILAYVQARNSIEVTQRPYVSIRPAKLGNESFLRFKEVGDGFVRVEMAIELMNRGNSPTNEIRLGKGFQISAGLFPDNAKTLLAYNTATLGPGESINLHPAVEIKLNDTDTLRAIEEYFDNGNILTLTADINYKWSARPKKNFSTKITMKLTPAQSRIVGSESI